MDMSRLRERCLNRDDCHAIAVNCAYQLGSDWIEVLFFGDCPWMTDRWQEASKFPGLVVTTCDDDVMLRAGIKVVARRNSPNGITDDPRYLRWNRNSGGCAVNLAYHLGAKRIVLVGFDMRPVDGDRNWHRQYKNWSDPKGHPYHTYIEAFEAIARDLKRLRVEFVNATPGSAMTCFPVIDPEKVLQ